MPNKPRFTARIVLKDTDPGTSDAFAEVQIDCHDGHVHRERGNACVVTGSPRFANADDAAAAQRNGLAAAFLSAWRRDGEAVLGSLRGGFAVLAVDSELRRVLLAVDRFAIQTLCHAEEDGVLSVSDRADAVETSDRSIDPQAIFDYLHFHMIPAPGTIFRSVRRLPMGHVMIRERGSWRLAPHLSLRFVEDTKPDFASARAQFMSILEASVAREIEGHGKVGAFLSGGTDSSTVAGLLGRVSGRAAPTYSIGFEAEGYDEMHYARIASRHFGCDHHEYYLTPDDLHAAIPDVARFHDQPFGNSSAAPAYMCARLARSDGCTKLLAGDGGDELFGGNTRYATQRFLELYHGLPVGLRRAIEPWCTEESVLRRIPGLRQAVGYVRHSKSPMPDRLQTTNLLTVLGPSRVLGPELMAQVDTEIPARHARETWSRGPACHFVNRMLAFDWRYTLGDSDLPKVRGAAEMAGIPVVFPLLCDELTDFSMALPPDWKLRHFKLRWFFKEALRGFLPDEIITKKKHGFGLPFGVWAVRHEGLRGLISRSLDQLVGRGVLRDEFRKLLLTELLPQHPGYYGEMVWLLLTLELWLESAEPGYTLPSGAP